MNRKLIGIIFAGAFLAFGTAVAAQRGADAVGNGRFGRGPGIGNLDRLSDALDLNASQVAAIETLMESRRAESEAIREQLRVSRQEMEALIDAADPLAVGNAVLAERALRDQLDAIRDQLLTDFRNVLTPAQQETFDGIQAMADGGREGPFEGPRPRRPRGRGL